MEVEEEVWFWFRPTGLVVCCQHGRWTATIEFRSWEERDIFLKSGFVAFLSPFTSLVFFKLETFWTESCFVLSWSRLKEKINLAGQIIGNCQAWGQKAEWTFISSKSEKFIQEIWMEKMHLKCPIKLIFNLTTFTLRLGEWLLLLDFCCYKESVSDACLVLFWVVAYRPTLKDIFWFLDIA